MFLDPDLHVHVEDQSNPSQERVELLTGDRPLQSSRLYETGQSICNLAYLFRIVSPRSLQDFNASTFDNPTDSLPRTKLSRRRTRWLGVFVGASHLLLEP